MMPLGGYYSVPQVGLKKGKEIGEQRVFKGWCLHPAEESYSN